MKPKFMYRVRVRWQDFLWCIGIAWHNNIEDECTKDFNCCENIGRKAWWRLEAKTRRKKECPECKGVGVKITGYNFTINGLQPSGFFCKKCNGTGKI